MKHYNFKPFRTSNVTMDLYSPEDEYLDTHGEDEVFQFMAWLCSNFKEGYHYRINPEFAHLFEEDSTTYRLPMENPRGIVKVREWPTFKKGTGIAGECVFQTTSFWVRKLKYQMTYPPIPQQTQEHE